METTSVYLHIPFCAQKCFYCDFAAYKVNGQPVDEYLDALEQELRLTVAEHPPGPIRTIFVGGGTPTILTAHQMERFLAMVDAFFPRRVANIEFTMEANPGTVDREKLAVMRAGGVNRISFGAQTFNERLLKKIGRDHDTRAIFKSVDDAQRSGYENISLDLMFGLPEQTVQDVNETLETAFQLRVQHFSAYALKVEGNTWFHTLQRKGQLPLPTDDEEYEMYQLVRDRMAAAGYKQYEISNYSHPKFTSQHNQTYWLNEPYYGIGVGAHGFVSGTRHANTRHVKSYIRTLSEGRLPREDQYRVTRTEDIENTMILGLRLLNGVAFSRFHERYGEDLRHIYNEALTKLKQKGWLAWDEERVWMTEEGLLWGNDVCAQFLLS